MMMPRITAFYAALLALLMLVLAARVVFYRRRARIGIGDGGDRALALRVRVHANFAENIPLALVLLLVLELLATVPLWLHVFGIGLVLGRVLHAVGLSRTAGTSNGRVLGTVLTWLAIAAMALVLLWQSVAWWLLTA
ncbi:MAG: MAPEG family protein [Pseudoxanthomonas sp.]|nr:MAPEG family protein [Pseudoxanthomonas sp.]